MGSYVKGCETWGLISLLSPGSKHGKFNDIILPAFQEEEWQLASGSFMISVEEGPRLRGAAL